MSKPVLIATGLTAELLPRAYDPYVSLAGRAEVRLYRAEAKRLLKLLTELVELKPSDG